MEPFKITTSREINRILLKIEGSIDETAHFPPFNCKPADAIYVDLGGVVHINSVGVKNWILFLKKVPFVNVVHYQNIPRIMVDQINMVSGFMNANSVITSFYVPYYCEKCSKSSQKLFVSGVDFDFETKRVDFETKNTEYVCVQKDCEIAMDVMPNKYFRFVTKEY